MSTRDHLQSLSLVQLLHRRFTVWRISRLTKRARRIADRIERLWTSIDMEMPS